MPIRSRSPPATRQRALELLASSPAGCSEAILAAHGFTVKHLVELVRAGLATAKIERMVAGQTISVGGIARKGVALAPETSLEEAVRYFSKDLSLTSIVVAEGGFARGVVMRHQLEYANPRDLVRVIPAN